MHPTSPSALARARPSPPLVAGATVVALVFAAPLGYLVVRVAGLDDVWSVLAEGDVTGPLSRSLLLATTVAAASAVLGTGLAWLTTRTDLPLRRLWATLAPLPLVFPSFIAAAALLAAVAPGGLFDTLVPGVVDRFPDVDGFGGAFVVLTLFSYPYVLLPVAARMRGLPSSFEESARLLGRSPRATFRTIVLPQSAGAVWAGALLVFLYVLSDFGAVAQLQYRTLTVEVFDNRLFDQPRALVLGLLLGVLAVAVVGAERGVGRRRARIEAARVSSAAAGPPLLVPLGRWRWPALAAVVVVLGNALFGPTLVLGFWGFRRSDSALTDLAGPAATTAGLALAAAALAVVVVLPAAFLTARHRTRLGSAVNGAVVGGFALPGLLIALAVVFWSLSGPSWMAALYQSIPLLLLAYVVHFGAQAMRSGQVAVAAVPARLDDAARVLGANRWRRLLSVEAPLMLPGLLAGGGLVLLSTMKELPATLLLRPTSVETLALRVWRARERAAWADTGRAGLALVALCAAFTWFLVIRRADHA